MKTRLILFIGVFLLHACGGGSGGTGAPTSTSPTTADVVSVTASASTDPVPSANITNVVVTVTNPSSVAAQSVVLSLNLGSGLSIYSVSCVSSYASCPADPATFNVGTLPANGSVTFYVSVSIPSGQRGVITSSVTAIASNDVTASNNSAQISFTVYSADVSLVASTTASEFVSGATIPYLLTLTNAGPDTARNIALDTPLNSGQSLGRVVCSASNGALCPTETGLNMTIPSIPAGATVNLRLPMTLPMTALASVSNTFTANTPGDPLVTNNRTTITVGARVPTAPTMSSFVKLQSDADDQIGQGRNYAYSSRDAVFGVRQASTGNLSFGVRGNENWQAVFQMPTANGQIVPGRYVYALGWPGNDSTSSGMSWAAESRSCTHEGWFVVDDVVYVSGQLSSIDLRFEQRCDGSAAPLRGQIHWYRDDATRPAGPVNPIPSGLWTPPATALPVGINYVYVESDGPQDLIGDGFVGTYTQANSVMSVHAGSAALDGQLQFSVRAENHWAGNFSAMSPLTRLEPGYYPIADKPAPNNNPAEGGMDISGGLGANNFGCMYVEGWFAVDNIVYVDGTPTAVDLRFEQHCDGYGVFRGSVHWRAGDTTQPPGPQVPPPSGLWAPAASAVPASGNFVYLESEGDYVVGSGTRLYTPLNSVITPGGGGFTPVANRFQLTVMGEEEWTGFFQAMNTLTKLAPGYYTDLHGFSGANNPAKGSLEWFGEGRGCSDLLGWFVIDELTYSGDTLTSIDLRFEQHCEGAQPALHGRIRWSAADTRVPPGPVNPPPNGLWSPPAGATPASGNYFYLASETGDFVGAGATHLYTSTDAVFQLATIGTQVNVGIRGDLWWDGYFKPMVSLTKLEPGLYDNLTSRNIAKGGLYWGGDGRACSNPGGWFVVDSAAYLGDAIVALDLRFEQRCSPGGPALHGKLHWRADDTAQPPGPVNPPPAGLWSPPAGATPTTGSFFYMQSDPGEFIGMGQTALLTPANASIDASTQSYGFMLGAQNGANGLFWSAEFKQMDSIPRLAVGYYPDVQQTLMHNPARGGMSVSGNSRSCNSRGWFIIDSISYVGDTVSAIDVRFEQRCGENTPALHGRIRWVQ